MYKKIEAALVAAGFKVMHGAIGDEWFAIMAEDAQGNRVMMRSDDAENWDY